MSLCKAPRVLNLFKTVRAVHWLGELHPEVYKDIYFHRMVKTLAGIRETFWGDKDVGHPSGDLLLKVLVEKCNAYIIAGGRRPNGPKSLEFNHETLDLDKFLNEVEYHLKGAREAGLVYELAVEEIYAVVMDSFKGILSAHGYNNHAINCSSCKYFTERGAEEQPGQHCYMFAEAPTETCMQHTAFTSN